MQRSIAVVALAATFFAPVAGFGQTLDGWSGFEFGMGPDQARKVPGYQFGRYSRKNLLDQNQGAMASKNPVTIDGNPYKFDLWFNAFESLYEINLQNEATGSRAECEARFLSLLTASEKTYGDFAPLYKEHKKNDQDTLPISIEWKQSGGKSRYQLATAYLGVETASVWDARKVYGGRYLDIATIWSAPRDDAQAVCLTQLDYRA